MPKTRLAAFVFQLSAVCFFAASSFASPPQKILYQGTLRRSGSVYTGNATFVFRLTDSSGATEYWTSGSTVVPVSLGLFRYPIGTDNAGGTGLNGKPLSGVDWPNITPYIEVTVDGTVLTPREAMASVPYALSNEDTTKLLKTGDAMTGPLTLSGSTLTISGNAFSVGGSTFAVVSGRIGIGTTNPAYPLDVQGDIRSTGSFVGNGALRTLSVSSGIYINSMVPSATAMTLYNDGGALKWNGSALAVGSSVSGTLGFVPKFTDSTSLGNSVLFESGGNVGLGTTAPATKLDINGTAQFGSGSSKSTFTSTGDLILASGSSITLSGINGFIASGSSITASAFFGYGGNLTGISAAETNTYTSSKTFTSSVLSGASVTASAFFGYGGNLTGLPSSEINTYVSSKTFTGNVLAGGSVTASAFFGYGGNLTGLPPSEINTYTSSKTFTADSFSVGGSSFTVSGGSATVAYRLSAGSFAGDGTALTGIPSTASISGTYLAKAGDAMTGPLTLLGSTLTVSGNAFSVGASTFVVAGGNVGIGTSVPGSKFDVEGGAQFGAGASKSSFTTTGALVMNSGSSITLSGASGFITSASSITASAFFGSGAGLTNITATQMNAAGLINGPVNSSILPSTVAYTTSANTFTSSQTITADAFSVGGSTLVVAGGNIGIGTTAPASQLHLNGTGGAQLNFLGHWGGNYFVQSSSGGLVLESWGTTAGPNPNVYVRSSRGTGTGKVYINDVANDVILANGGGLVGIGTANPATTLEVNGSAQFGSGISKSTFTSVGALVLASGSSITLSGANGFITSASSITASAFFGSGAALTNITATQMNAAGLINGPVNSAVLPSTVAYTTSANTFASSQTIIADAFSVGGSTLVVTSGRLGIGTTNPSATLHVNGQELVGAAGLDADVTSLTGTPFLGIVGNNAPTIGMVSVANADNNVGATFYGLKTRSSASDANTIVQNGDGVLEISGWGSNGTTYNPVGRILIAVDAEPGASDMPGRITFATTEDATSTLHERMRITSFGNINLGTGATKSTFSATGALSLASNAALTLSGATGNIATGSSVTASAFFGNGAALSGIPSSASISGTYVAKGGDTMSGNLYSPHVTASTSMTVTGNAFSVGGTTLVVAGGSIGVGTESPAAKFDVNGDARFGATGKSTVAATGIISVPSMNIGPVQGVPAGVSVLQSRGKASSGYENWDYIGTGALDGKNWGHQYNNTNFAERICNDALNSCTNWMVVDRVGQAPSQVTFPSSAKVGIGTSSPANTLQVNGNSCIGNCAAAAGTALANGLLVQDGAIISSVNYTGNWTNSQFNLGIKNYALTNTARNSFSMGVYQKPGDATKGQLVFAQHNTLVGSAPNGILCMDPDTNGISIGNTYCASGGGIPPANGMIISGSVGIGTTSPATTLEVNGNSQFGSGASKSTFTTTGALTLAGNAALTLSGASGNIASASSVTASAFFGNGSSLIGIGSAAGNNTWTGNNTWSLASATQTFAGPISIGAPTTADNRTYLAIGPSTLAGNSGSDIVVNFNNPGNTIGTNMGLLIGDMTATGAGLDQIGFGFLGNHKMMGGANAFPPMVIGGRQTNPALGVPTAFFVATSTSPNTNIPTEKFTIMPDGSVGIGTSIPGSLVDIYGGKIYFSSNTTAANVELGGIVGESYNIHNPGTTAAEVLLLTDSSAGWKGAISFRTNNTDVTNSRASERMRIDAVGNVGIGMTGPSAKLHLSSGTLLIDGDDGAGIPFKIGVSTFIISGGKIGIGTSAPQSPVDIFAGKIFFSSNTTDAGVELGGIAGESYNSHNPGTTAAEVMLLTDASVGSKGAISFRTNNTDATNSRAAERMRIDAAGNIGVNTVSPASKLHVHDGDIRISTTSGSKGIYFQDGSLQITAAAGGNLWADRGSNNISNTNSANVGIGTLVPTTKLHMSSGILTIDGAGAGMTLANTAAATFKSTITANSLANFSNPSSTQAVFSGFSAETGPSASAGMIVIGGGVTDGLRLQNHASGAEAAFIETVNDRPINICTNAGGTRKCPIKAAIDGSVEFRNTTSTSVIVKGFSAYGGATDNAGLIQIGGTQANSATLDLTNFGAVTVLRITNATNADTSRIDFNMKTAGTTPTIPLSLNGAGRVGIGTTNPIAGLMILRDNEPGLYIGKASHDTVAGPYDVNASSAYLHIGYGEYGQGTYKIIAFGHNDGDLQYSPVYAGILQSGGDAHHHQDFVIGTRNSGTYTVAPSERLRITYDGKIGIGTTAPGNLLHVNGASTFVSTANFTNAASTQAVFSGFSAKSGANVNSGQIAIGANGRLTYDNAVTGDFFIENMIDSNTGDIVFGLRGNGTLRNPLILSADDARTSQFNGIVSVLNAVSTQVYVSGFSSRGANTGSGQILIGNGARFSFDHAVTDDMFIENMTDGAAADIVFNVRGDGTSLTPLKLLGTGAVQILPAGGGPEIPFQIGISSLVVLSSGAVGIGTTNPSTKLDVLGTVTATQFIGGGAGLAGVPEGNTFGPSSKTFTGSVSFPTLAAGRIAISTKSPSYTIEVGEGGTVGVSASNTSSAYLRGGAGPTYGRGLNIPDTSQLGGGSYLGGETGNVFMSANTSFFAGWGGFRPRDNASGAVYAMWMDAKPAAINGVNAEQFYIAYSSAQADVGLTVNNLRRAFMVDRETVKIGNEIAEVRDEGYAFRIGLSSMVVMKSGNVGIGTSWPATKLHMSSGTFLVDGNTATPFQIGISSLVVLSSGAVGMGTTNPTEMLHLKTAGSARLLLESDTDDTTETDQALLQLSQDGGTTQAHFGFRYGANGLYIGHENNYSMSLETNNTTRMTILGGGNIGIGTTGPAGKLHVSSGVVIIDGSGGALQFPDGTTQVTAASAGGSVLSSMTLSATNASNTSFSTCYATVTAVADGSSFAEVTFGGHLGVATANYKPCLAFLVDGLFMPNFTAAKGACMTQMNPAPQGQYMHVTQETAILGAGSHSFCVGFWVPDSSTWYLYSDTDWYSKAEFKVRLRK